MSAAAALVEPSLAGKEGEEVLPQFGIGDLSHGSIDGGFLLFVQHGERGRRRRGRGTRLYASPAQIDVANRLPAEALGETRKDLRLHQLKLLHPDGLVDSYFEYPVAQS
jgi:hypothetical protein